MWFPVRSFVHCLLNMVGEPPPFSPRVLKRPQRYPTAGRERLFLSDDKHRLCAWSPPQAQPLLLRLRHLWNMFDTKEYAPPAFASGLLRSVSGCGGWSPYSDWYAQ